MTSLCWWNGPGERCRTTTATAACRGCPLDLDRGALILGGVLLVAGALKVIDPQSSVAAVRAYELLPAWLATVSAGACRSSRSLSVCCCSGWARHPAAAAAWAAAA